MNTIKQYKLENMSFIEITNNSDFKVTLTDFGASIYTIYFKNKLMNVQVQDPKDFKHHYVRYGKTIGRVAGRIEHARYTANGHTYHVTANEGMNCLHGGDCFAQATFEIASVENIERGTKVVFHYLSKDKECGFGGNLDLNVIYRIKTDVPAIHIEYEYVCDKDCPVNITNHSYYSLGDHTVNHLYLYLNSNRHVYARYLDMIPTSLTVVDKCLDFSKSKLITKDIDNPSINRGRLAGYDHFYLFNEVDGDTKQVILENTKFKMIMYTDYSGTQIYTNNGAKPIKCLNTSAERRRGVAIEPRNSPIVQSIMAPANHKMHHTITINFEEKI